MAGKIVLFGATGYTGRLTAEALVERQAKPVLAARNEAKLEALAAELGGELETATADVSRPETIGALVGPEDVLVSTVGPFGRWGAPAVEAAIAAGATYIDSTGEAPFIRRVFEEWDGPARSSGTALLTAMGYDWVPGNLAAELALAEAGEAATRVVLGYFFTGAGGMSGGTNASSVETMLHPGYTYRDGSLVTERLGKRLREFDLRGRTRPALSASSSEHFTIPPRHPRVLDVDVYLGWFGSRSRPLQLISTGLSLATRLPGVRATLGGLGHRFVKGSTGGPGEEQRARSGSQIVAIAEDSGGAELARVVLEGADGYTFTAGMLAFSATEAAAGRIEGAGALGPADAFGVERLEAGVGEAGISRA